MKEILAPMSTFPRLPTLLTVSLLGYSLANFPVHAGLIEDYPAGLAGQMVTHIGAVTSQGDNVLNTDTARSSYGVEGSGIRIGIISDSFNAFAQSDIGVDSGELPGAGNPNGYSTPVQVIKDQLGGGYASDEGRAMAEIVHDIAPGAEIYFHSAFNNGYGNTPDQTIADAITALSAAVGPGGIIVDDVGILTAPRFQDGAAAQAVNAAKASGIAYFSAAGNNADHATRGSVASGVGSRVNWGSDETLEVYFDGGLGRFTVHWDDPYQTVSGPATVSDYAIVFTDVAGNSELLTIDRESTDAFEFAYVSGGAGYYGIQVECVANCDGNELVQLSMFNSFTITDSDDTNSPTVFGHAAAEGAIAVAAQRYDDLYSVEWFSSLGGTEIRFDADGNPVTVYRDSLAFTAPQGTNNSFFGSDYAGDPDSYPNFFGTSASAPHAAALAALVMEYAVGLGSALSVDQLYDVLLNGTVDIDAPGYDAWSGFGRLDALEAFSYLQQQYAGSVALPSGLLLMLTGGLLLRVRRR